MTRKHDTRPIDPAKAVKAPRAEVRDAPSSEWRLQDAKARFSEPTRRVRTDGPQRVTVHGRDEVVIISAEESRSLKGEAMGSTLVEAMQASPHREVELDPGRHAMPVRTVEPDLVIAATALLGGFAVAT